MTNKLRIKWYMFTFILIILASCTLEEPVLPEWFVQWRIPFTTDFSMNEALDDPNFITDTTGTGETRIAISIVDSSEKKTVSSSDLGIRPDAEHSGENIDQLTLGTLGPVKSNEIGISDILGIPVSEGMVVDIPDTTVTVNLIYLFYVDVASAQVENGLFRLEFVNHTFFDIQEGMLITIYDDSINSPLGSVEINNPIASMDSAIAVPDLDLSDQEIHTRFLLEIDMPLAAVNNRVLSAADVNGTAWINGTLIDVDVYSANAIFPPQTIDLTDSSSIIDEDHRIRSAEIANGLIDVAIENQLDVTSHVAVRLLNFQSISSGEVFSSNIRIPAGAPKDTVFNVQGYRIVDYPNPNSGNLIDYLQYEINVITDSPEDYVTITRDDSVLVDVTPDSIFFNKIDGEVDMIEIEIDPVIKDDLDDLSRIDGQIFLDSLQMRLNLYNQTNLPINITLYISGSKGAEQVPLAPINRQIPPIDQGGFLQIKLDANDPSPNIIDMISILPNTIRLDADAFVDGSGSVEVGQEVWADYQIFSPLFLRIAGPAAISSDIQEEELDEEVRDKLENNVRYSEVSIDVLNGLPVGARASLYVAHDSTDLFEDTIADSTTKFIIPDLEISAGQVGADGYVQQKATDNIPIQLDQSKLVVFYTTDKIYIGIKTTLDQTDDLVKFRPADNIEISGFFGFQYLMKE